MEQPPNNVIWRVTRLEEDVRELQKGQPAVIAERVSTLAMRIGDLKVETHEDIESLRSELASQRRILIGFFVSSAIALLGITLTFVLNGFGA